MSCIYDVKGCEYCIEERDDSMVYCPNCGNKLIIIATFDTKYNNEHHACIAVLRWRAHLLEKKYGV